MTGIQVWTKQKKLFIEKKTRKEYELPDDIVVDSNNQSQEQQTTEEGTCYVNGKAYLFDQNGAMIKAL